MTCWLTSLAHEYNDVFPLSVAGFLTCELSADQGPFGSRRWAHTMPKVPFVTQEIAEIQQQVTNLLDKGLITPSTSPFGAAVLREQTRTGMFGW